MPTEQGDPDDECIHLIYPATSCHVCHPPRPIIDPLALDSPMMHTDGIRAEHQTWCSGCQSRIDTGELIVLSKGQWVHDGCD